DERAGLLGRRVERRLRVLAGEGRPGHVARSVVEASRETGEIHAIGLFVLDRAQEDVGADGGAVVVEGGLVDFPHEAVPASDPDGAVRGGVADERVHGQRILVVYRVNVLPPRLVAHVVEQAYCIEPNLNNPSRITTQSGAIRCGLRQFSTEASSS